MTEKEILIKRGSTTAKNGNEFCYARALGKQLGYSDYRNFKNVIKILLIDSSLFYYLFCIFFVFL